MRHFALMLAGVVVVLLHYAYVLSCGLMAGLATLHLVAIILGNGCARECTALFACRGRSGPASGAL